MTVLWTGVIPHQPYSKANSRRMVINKKTHKPMFIKSASALAFERSAALTLPTLDPLILGPVGVTCWLYYTTERSDLDPSLCFDVLQGKIIKNDRQIREMHVHHGIDKQNPRAVIQVYSLSEES